MSSLINEILPQSGFEIVKIKIGNILFHELNNQKSMQPFSYPVNVFVDRMIPFDKKEVCVVNVRLESINKSNHGQRNSFDDVVYTLDVFSAAKQNDNEKGDFVSTSIRDKFVGMITSILQSGYYSTLGFEPGLIMSSNISGVEVFEASNNNDGSFVSMSRINLSVRLFEDYKTWKGVLLDNNLTDVKLDLTELGYKYQLI
jgi:hypothetical protein